MVRSRDRARTAALQAEVVALRSIVAELREELGRVRAEAAASAAAAVAAAAPAPPSLAEVRWVTLQMPLVQLALGDPADVTKGPEVAAALAHPDRGEDTAETEIVLDAGEPADRRRADRLAWTVLANLPERPLLDPRPTATPSPGTRLRPRRPPSTGVPPDPADARPAVAADARPIRPLPRWQAGGYFRGRAPRQVPTRLPYVVDGRGRPAGVGYLSMSPTTKNIEPRIATMSATRQPGQQLGQHLRCC